MSVVLDVAFNREGGGIGGGVGPIRSSRRGRSGRKSTKKTTTETSNYMAGHPSLSYFPGTFAHPGLLAPAFTPRPPEEEMTSPPCATRLTSSDPCLSRTVCPQQTQSTKTIDAPSMDKTHYIPSRILSPIPSMRQPDDLSPLSRPPSPPLRSRRRTTSPLAPESLHKPRPNRPRFPRSRIEPSLLRVAVMTQLIKRCKASDDYDTISLKGGAGGVVIMQKLPQSRSISAGPRYSELPALSSGVLSG